MLPKNSFSKRELLLQRTPFFYGWVIVVVSGITMFFRNSASTLTIAVFVFPMSEELGWSRTTIVGAAVVGGLASMFILPMMGWVQQRLGARVSLTSSMLILGLVITGLRWADSILTFYILFALGRVVFSAPVQVGATTAVAQWFTKFRGRATAVTGVLHSIGMGFFPLMAQLLMNVNNGDWRMAWFWMGISVWVVALPAAYFLLVHRPENLGVYPDGVSRRAKSSTIVGENMEYDRDPSWTLKQAARTPALWMLALSGGLLFFIHTGVNIHQAAFLRDQGLSASVAASALTIMAVGTGLGSLIWGIMMDRYPVRLVYAITAVWLGVVVLLFRGVDSVPMAFFVAGMFGIGLGGLLIVPPVAIANYFGRNSLAAIRGVTEPFVSGGQAIGAITSGLVYDLTNSYMGTFPIFTVAAAIGLILIFLARKPKAKIEVR